MSEPLVVSINADHPLHLDRRALASRDRITNPYFNLWSALMELAQQRVQIVLKWAREWTEYRFEDDYEQRRARVRYHLDWILSDDSGARFSFADICSFAENPDLQDFDTVRDRILGAFDKFALEALMMPVHPRLLKESASRYLYSLGCEHRNQKGSSMTTNRHVWELILMAGVLVWGAWLDRKAIWDWARLPSPREVEDSQGRSVQSACVVEEGIGAGDGWRQHRHHSCASRVWQGASGN